MHNLKILHAFICPCLLLLMIYVNTQLCVKMKENRQKDKDVHPQICTKIEHVITSWRLQIYNQIKSTVQKSLRVHVLLPYLFLCLSEKSTQDGD